MTGTMDSLPSELSLTVRGDAPRCRRWRDPPPRLNETTPTYTHSATHTMMCSKATNWLAWQSVNKKVDVGQQLLLLAKEETEEVRVKKRERQTENVCVWNTNSSHTELPPPTPSPSY